MRWLAAALIMAGSLASTRLVPLPDDLVYLRVVVTDDSGLKLTTGLTRKDFEVTERKRQRLIEYFSSQPGPVSLTIVLDFSESMTLFALPEPEKVVRLVADETSKIAETSILTFASSLYLAKSFQSDPDRTGA